MPALGLIVRTALERVKDRLLPMFGPFRLQIDPKNYWLIQPWPLATFELADEDKPRGEKTTQETPKT